METYSFSHRMTVSWILIDFIQKSAHTKRFFFLRRILHTYIDFSFFCAEQDFVKWRFRREKMLHMTEAHQAISLNISDEVQKGWGPPATTIRQTITAVVVIIPLEIFIPRYGMDMDAKRKKIFCISSPAFKKCAKLHSQQIAKSKQQTKAPHIF